MGPLSHWPVTLFKQNTRTQAAGSVQWCKVLLLARCPEKWLNHWRSQTLWLCSKSYYHGSLLRVLTSQWLLQRWHETYWISKSVSQKHKMCKQPKKKWDFFAPTSTSNIYCSHRYILYPAIKFSYSRHTIEWSHLRLLTCNTWPINYNVIEQWGTTRA